MNILRLSDMRYPLTEGEVVASMPHVSFPSVFALPEGHVEVFASPRPEYDPRYYTPLEGVPAYSSDGVYVQTWSLVKLTKAEQSAYAKRQLDTLEDAKLHKCLQISTWRFNADFGSFAYKGHQFKCNLESRSAINVANGLICLIKDLPKEWRGGWSAEGGALVPICSVQEWTDFYSALYAHTEHNFARARALKAAVRAMDLLTSVEALTWDSELLPA